MWNEKLDDSVYQVPDDIIDIHFKISCESLPVDHVQALSSALQDIAPWLDESPVNAVHDIYGAGTGNGWQRSDNATDLMYLSRRTPLIIRIHQSFINDALNLSGKTLNIAGHTLTIGKGKKRILAKTDTLRARNVYFPVDNETDFLNAAQQQMASLGIICNKMLCGKSISIQISDKMVLTHSLMIADLSFPDAVKLQQLGIGEHRLYGCGIFTPHKTLSTPPSTD